MPPLDLDDAEKAGLAELLIETNARDRFPLSPRGAQRHWSGEVR